MIVVHLFGIPDNINEIRKICKKKNIYLIEDASQAHGAEIDGKKVGGFGIASFLVSIQQKILVHWVMVVASLQIIQN